MLKFQNQGPRTSNFNNRESRPFRKSFPQRSPESGNAVSPRKSYSNSFPKRSLESGNVASPRRTYSDSYSRSYSDRGERSGYNGNRFNDNRGKGNFGGNRPPQRSFSDSRFGNSKNKIRKETLNTAMYIRKAVPVENKAVFTPAFKYADLDLHADLAKNILNKGYTVPTPIQNDVVLKMLEGKDILGIANTGTGKTAAFLIPLIQKSLNLPGQKVLIVTPTRELADQINEEFYALSRNLRLYSVRCTGGTNINWQIDNIRRGYNFIIGTPGRLLDLQKRNIINFSQINNLVLDEVDRMLDMGFVDPIRQIVACLPKQKHTSFFSATSNQKVERLITEIMQNEFVKISVKSADTSQNVDQDVIRFSDRQEKLGLLEGILRDETATKVLVFVGTKRYVDTLQKALSQKGIGVASIHGDKRQNERNRSIQNFKKGVVNILLATDVAARGLDISNVSHVINFDEPNTFDDYVHRIGRTGRGDQQGKALTFVQR
ncbi:MAG: DEAD/DEAH box helicase [bacterium]